MGKIIQLSSVVVLSFCHIKNYRHKFQSIAITSNMFKKLVFRLMFSFSSIDFNNGFWDFQNLRNEKKNSYSSQTYSSYSKFSSNSSTPYIQSKVILYENNQVTTVWLSNTKVFTHFRNLTLLILEHTQFCRINELNNYKIRFHRKPKGKK